MLVCVHGRVCVCVCIYLVSSRSTNSGVSSGAAHHSVAAHHHSHNKVGFSVRSILSARQGRLFCLLACLVSWFLSSLLHCSGIAVISSSITALLTTARNKYSNLCVWRYSDTLLAASLRCRRTSKTAALAGGREPQFTPSTYTISGISISSISGEWREFASKWRIVGSEQRSKQSRGFPAHAQQEQLIFQ